MKKFKKYFLISFTLLLTLLGAALPYIAAGTQDARIARDGTVRALDAVDLNFWEPTGLCQTLALFQNSNNLRLDAPGETRLTEDEVLNAARDTVWQLRRAGLLESWRDDMTLDIFPRLVFSEDDGASAVLWFCYDDGNTCQMVVDDASGKMIGLYWLSPWIFEFDEGESQVIVYDSDWDTFVEEAYALRLTQWARFCEEYYAQDVERVEGAFADEGMTRDDARNCVLRFFLRDGTEACAPRLILWEDFVAFNS